jgi:hypothetical protein
MMKKLLYGVLLAVLAIAGPTQANQNLVQNPDGTASWSSSRGELNPQAVHLQLVIGLNATNGSTHYVVSPVSDAKIIDARLARQGTALNGPMYVKLFAGQAITPMRLQGTITAANLPVVFTTTVSDSLINVGVSSNVTTYAITAPGGITNGQFINNTVARGDFISVFVTGTNTINSTGFLIITIAPK